MFSQRGWDSAQVKLVLTEIISQQEVNHYPFRKAYPQHSPCLLPEQAFGILAARIYFSAQQHALVGHLANAEAIPYSRGIESFDIPEAI